MQSTSLDRRRVRCKRLLQHRPLRVAASRADSPRGDRRSGGTTITRRDRRRDRRKEDIVRFIPVLVAAAAVAAASPVLAQGPDANLARNLAATCANCHGTNGVSAGRHGEPRRQPARTSSSARCRSSSRAAKPGTIMPQLAKGYTDAQIELIAGWFAAQKARQMSCQHRETTMSMQRRDFLKTAVAGYGGARAARLRDDGAAARPARWSSSAAATAARRRQSTSGCGATAAST